MKIFQPKLFSALKDYNLSKLGNDFIAGVIVAIIALPLSIALALLIFQVLPPLLPLLLRVLWHRRVQVDWLLQPLWQE